MQFDIVSLLIGAAGMFLIFWIPWIIKSLRKPKYDLYNLKKIVNDAGVNLLSSYKNIKELEKFFNEVGDK
jgi:hypothetical protein